MQKCTLVFGMVVALLIILQPQEIVARMTLAQMRNALKGVTKPCISKSGVDPDIVAKTKNGEFPPDRALQCYHLCLYGQMKVLKDGKISTSMINKQIDLVFPTDIIERSKEVIQICDDKTTSTDDCERSWEFTKCYYETDPSIYFFP